MNRFKFLALMALLSLPAGAAFFYQQMGGSLYVLGGTRYEIPNSYQRSVLGLLPELRESSLLEEGGNIQFIYFENEELRSRFSTYVSKYGEENFNTLFSVMVFQSDTLGSFEDEFLYFLPEDGVGVEVNYDLTRGLYRYDLDGMDYKQFFGTRNPYKDGFNSEAEDAFFTCTVWPSDPIEGSVCEYNTKMGAAVVGFRVAYANLHLYQELQDFFFEKLESWRVE